MWIYLEISEKCDDLSSKAAYRILQEFTFRPLGWLCPPALQNGHRAIHASVEKQPLGKESSGGPARFFGAAHATQSIHVERTLWSQPSTGNRGQIGPSVWGNLARNCSILERAATLKDFRKEIFRECGHGIVKRLENALPVPSKGQPCCSAEFGGSLLLDSSS